MSNDQFERTTYWVPWADGIKLQLGEDKVTFFQEINVLTNKFEPFDNFATEQAKFELNKCTQ